MCYSQMNTSGFQVHFLSFNRNISVQFIGRVLCCRRHCGYTVDTGASGMQIQYNYVTLYTKTILRNAFSILMHILFA